MRQNERDKRIQAHQIDVERCEKRDWKKQTIYIYIVKSLQTLGAFSSLRIKKKLHTILTKAFNCISSHYVPFITFYYKCGPLDIQAMG